MTAFREGIDFQVKPSQMFSADLGRILPPGGREFLGSEVPQEEEEGAGRNSEIMVFFVVFSGRQCIT